MEEEAMKVTFTDVEIKHLLRLLLDAVDDGSYYGNKQQYWARHKRIVSKLYPTLPSRDDIEW